MSTVMQLLRFPPLPIIDRFRLGLLIALAQLSRDWKALDRQSIEEWLVRLGGRSLFDRLWEPMLAAKFDGEFKELAATWMWARLVRMKSTRDGTNQRERAGHLIGGYATLLSAMARRITAAGGRIRLSCPVERVAIENQRVVGVIAGGELHRTAHVAVTMQGPILSRLIADAPADLVRGLESIRYLGIVCPLVILDRPLTGVWTVSIADKAVPFTGVIETTAYIDPQYVGGHHLVYLPKYTAGDSPWQRMTDDEVREACLATLEKMFPTFSRVHVRYVLVHRERYAEPLHTVAAPPLPGVQTAVRGLYLATTAQIYPQIAAGESVTRHASTAADLISNSLSIESRALPQPAAGTAMRSTTSHDIRQPVPSFGRTS
jgi:protoporphyrinogen oxidase